MSGERSRGSLSVRRRVAGRPEAIETRYGFGTVSGKRDHSVGRRTARPKMAPVGRDSRRGHCSRGRQSPLFDYASSPAPKGLTLTDGTRLYFSESVGGRTVLAQVSITGGETVLIPTPFQNAFPLDVSPTGSELLVGSYTDMGAPESLLWILPALGGSPRRFGDVVAHDGAWSPDGREIAYANGATLYLAKNDGAESRKLATVDGLPSRIRWSPDGRALRFTLSEPNRHSSSLWEVKSDGTNLHPLLPGWSTPSSERNGIWTPD